MSGGTGCSGNASDRVYFRMKWQTKKVACVSDTGLLTLHSGGGGGKSSPSILPALLLHQLFSQLSFPDTFLKEKHTQVTDGELVSVYKALAFTHAAANSSTALVSVDVFWSRCVEVTLIQTNDSMTENKSTSCASQGLLTQQRAEVYATFSYAN